MTVPTVYILYSARVAVSLVMHWERSTYGMLGLALLAALNLPTVTGKCLVAPFFGHTVAKCLFLPHFTYILYLVRVRAGCCCSVRGRQLGRGVSRALSM